MGKSKVGGLFPVALERLGIDPSTMVYVGDSIERDVKPAREAGIRAVLDEDEVGFLV